MIRKLLGAVCVLGLCIGLAVGDEIKGKITKVEGDTITVKSKKDGEKTLNIKDAKIVKGKNEDAASAADLKVGGGAAVTYDGEKASKVVIMMGKKKD